jgi:hypothetical protein
MKPEALLQLIRGAAYVRDVPCPLVLDETGAPRVFRIRPLTQAESAEASAALMAGIPSEAFRMFKQAPGAAGFDPGGASIQALTGNHAEYCRRVAAFGLSVDGETWTAADAGELPAAVVEWIVSQVSNLSGIGEAASAATFQRSGS